MIRRFWRDPRFWMWWWRNEVSMGAKLALGVLALVALGAAGYSGADKLARTTPAGRELVRTHTVERVVTLPAVGRASMRNASGAARTVTAEPLVRAVRGRTATVYETQTVLGTAAAAGLRTVTVERPGASAVETDGQATLTVEGGTTTATVTEEHVVTDEREVTVTETRDRRDTRTVTVTVTDDETVTVTDEETVTVTETETAPPITITIPLG